MTHTLTKHLFRFLLLMEEITSWYEKNIPIICKKLSCMLGGLALGFLLPSTVLTTWNFLPPPPGWFWDWGSILCVRAWNWSALESTSRGGGFNAQNESRQPPRNLQMKADLSVWRYTCMCLFSMLSIHFFHLKMELVEKTFENFLWNGPIFFWRIPLLNFQRWVFFGGPENLYVLQWWTLRSRIYTPVN